MKNIPSLILVLLLIVLPFVSWYYLNTGMEYRKAALHQLVDRGIVLDYINIDTTILSGKTTLIELDANIDPKIRAKVYDQFKDAYTFQYLCSDRNQAELGNFVVRDMPEVINDTLRGATYAVVDRRLNLRNVYKLSDKGAIQDMVSQLSILLPWAPKRDIKMKHGR